MNDELPKTKIDEKTGIEYHLEGDYYIPNLYIEPEETNYEIIKYGRLKLRYLIDFKKAEYITLFMEKKLNNYLHQIDEECEERLEILIEQMKEKENVTEELKLLNQMEWVQKMNSIKNRAEEIIYNELILE